MALSKRKDALLDPFKRAVTLATRAIAADNEVEVGWSTGLNRKRHDVLRHGHSVGGQMYFPWRSM